MSFVNLLPENVILKLVSGTWKLEWCPKHFSTAEILSVPDVEQRKEKSTIPLILLLIKFIGIMENENQTFMSDITNSSSL